MVRPVNQTKNKLTLSRWRLAKKETDNLADRMGKPIDPMIITAVTALRAHAFPTTGSCEGHLRWGLPAPWIDVGVSTKRPVNRSGVRRKNLLMQRRLVRLLDRFYEHRVVASGERLVIVPVGIFGGFCIKNQGAEYQGLYNLDIRRKKLKAFQNEFAVFAEFLKAEL